MPRDEQHEPLRAQIASLRAELAKVKAQAEWAANMLKQLQGNGVEINLPVISLSKVKAAETTQGGSTGKTLDIRTLYNGFATVIRYTAEFVP